MNKASRNLRKLAKKATSSNEQAEHDFFAEIRPYILAGIRAVGLQSNDADEVVQEVTLSLMCQERLLSLAAFHSDDKLKGYAFICGKRAALKQIRIQNRYNHLIRNYTPSLPDSIEPQEYLVGLDRISKLDKCINKLDTTGQQIIHMRYCLDMGFDDIGKHLKISGSTARQRHHRILKDLQKCMQEGNDD